MTDNTPKLLVLDLDETLIHATKEKLNISEDFIFDKYFVYKRPFLDFFLNEISKIYKIGIWSSAHDEYVESVVKSIKPENIEFEIIWGRSKCTHRRDFEQDIYVHEKRLDKLKKKGFRMEQILIVDDTREKSRTNYGNSIPIREFTGDPMDQELKYLLSYLHDLKDTSNVRTIEKRHWRQKGNN